MPREWNRAGTADVAEIDYSGGGGRAVPASSTGLTVIEASSVAALRSGVQRQATAVRVLGSNQQHGWPSAAVPSPAPLLDTHEDRDVIGMSSNAYGDWPEKPRSAPREPATTLAGLTGPVDEAGDVTRFARNRSRAAVPPENFLAWNALRLTQFAGLVLRTHVPRGPHAFLVVHTCVQALRLPTLRLPALRCASCTDSRWPCRLVAWAHDWVARLPAVVAALDHPGRLADGVPKPVAVGDVQVPAVTWGTSSTGGRR